MLIVVKEASSLSPGHDKSKSPTPSSRQPFAPPASKASPPLSTDPTPLQNNSSSSSSRTRSTSAPAETKRGHSVSRSRSPSRSPSRSRSAARSHRRRRDRGDEAESAHFDSERARGRVQDREQPKDRSQRSPDTQDRGGLAGSKRRRSPSPQHARSSRPQHPGIPPGAIPVPVGAQVVYVRDPNTGELRPALLQASPQIPRLPVAPRRAAHAVPEWKRWEKTCSACGNVGIPGHDAGHPACPALARGRYQNRREHPSYAREPAPRDYHNTPRNEARRRPDPREVRPRARAYEREDREERRAPREYSRFRGRSSERSRRKDDDDDSQAIDEFGRRRDRRDRSRSRSRDPSHSRHRRYRSRDRSRSRSSDSD